MYSLTHSCTWPVHVRNAAFIDDARVLLTDGAGNVWQANPFEAQASLLHPGESVLYPITTPNPWIHSPAGGAYPLIASSKSGASIVVSIADVVLSLKSPNKDWTLIAGQFGLYYPKIDYSPYHDGKFVLVHADCWTLVFEAATGNLVYEAKTFVASAWHPTEPRLLVIDGDGGMSWIDFSEEQRQPVAELFGAFDQSTTGPLDFDFVTDLIMLSESQCIVPFEHLLAGVEIPSGLVTKTSPIDRRSQVHAHHRRGYAVIGLGKEAWLWNLYSLEPIQKMPAIVDQAFFSPTGKYLLTLDALPSNPYPRSPTDRFREGSIWVIDSESGTF